MRSPAMHSAAGARQQTPSNQIKIPVKTVRWPGRTPAAWQAGQCAVIPMGNREEGQRLHTKLSPLTPTPAPRHSRTPPDPVVLFQHAGLVTCEQHSRQGSSGGRGAVAAGKATSRRCSREYTRTLLLASPCHVHPCMALCTCNTGRMGSPANQPQPCRGGVGSWVAELAVAQVEAQAEAPLPAAAAHTEGASSGHAESPASTGADLWHLPALQTARLLGRLNHPTQGPRQDLCTQMKRRPSPPSTGSPPGGGLAPCCASCSPLNPSVPRPSIHPCSGGRQAPKAASPRVLG